MKHMLLALIGFYRYAVSPMLGRRCRFFPSCSEYATEAVEKYGAGKGARLGPAPTIPLSSVESGWF
jgi:putative component of membrane protein insertase Oxa1/YidC/SpoIIIJ protein YidD